MWGGRWGDKRTKPDLAGHTLKHKTKTLNPTRKVQQTLKPKTLKPSDLPLHKP